MKLDRLTDLISETNTVLAQQAGKSVNMLLTIRNWLIGLRIQKYEQVGEDRAEYGEKLIQTLSKRLGKKGVPGCSESRLYAYRLLYNAYPEILSTVSTELEALINQRDISSRILLTLSTESQQNKRQLKENAIPKIPVLILIKNIPYSSFAELIRIDDPLKRSFYEVECLRGQWSTRELRRQITTLYYERSAYSTPANTRYV